MTPAIADVMLPAALGFIMFALGITLRPADFTRLADRPRAVLAGLVGQQLLLPAFAWTLALAWRLPPEMAVGLVMIGACPGGASSGLITHLARGETALSITLTAITSLTALVSVPLVVNGALHFFLGTATAVELPIGRLVRGVFFITTIPVVAGMALRAWRPALAQRLEQPAGRIATVLFLLIVIATFVNQREVLIANMPAVGPAAALLNLASMLAGVGVAAFFGLVRRDAIAIATECGLHNAALGIFLASSILGKPAFAIPSVIYALLMNVGALGLVVFARRQTA